MLNCIGELACLGWGKEGAAGFAAAIFAYF